MDVHSRSKSNLEVAKNMARRHSAPDLISDSVQLTGASKSWKGSRFWALEDDSDRQVEGAKQREEDPNLESYDSEREFINDATQAGFSLDELIRAETLLTENFQSPKFTSVDRGGGHIRHPRPLASRITEAVADLRLQRDEKPWKGPLPKIRAHHYRQLGDVRVKDLRQSSTFKIV